MLGLENRYLSVYLTLSEHRALQALILILVLWIEPFSMPSSPSARRAAADRLAATALDPQVRSWDAAAAARPVSAYAALVAPMGRDREMAPKGHWLPGHSTFLGLRHRAAPPFPTRSALRAARLREVQRIATDNVNNAFAATYGAAVKEEAIARAHHYSTHVPLTRTQSALFARRRQQPVQEAQALKAKSRRMRDSERRRVMTAPAIPKGWWQKGDRVLDSREALKKGSPVRLRTIAQRTVQPETDPFKQYETSIFTMTRTRDRAQKQSVELAVVDRSGPEWAKGESHLPKQPQIPVKRWSDVVIEFAQADQKLNDERMAQGGGGTKEEGGEGGDEAYGGRGAGGGSLNMTDTQPLYSSFTDDQIFREPVYGVKKKEPTPEEEAAAQFLLKPLGKYEIRGSGTARSMNLMQRMRRQQRFRDVLAERLHERQQAATLGIVGGSTAGSEFGRGSPRGGGTAGSRKGLGSATSSFAPLPSGVDVRLEFRDRGSTPKVGARGGGSGSLGATFGTVESDRPMSTPSRATRSRGGGGSGIPRAKTMSKTQSVPALGGTTAPNSRASTSHSTRRPGAGEAAGGGAGGAGAGIARGSTGRAGRDGIREALRASGGRPSTAPFSLRSFGGRPRTRGFLD